MTATDTTPRSALAAQRAGVAIAAGLRRSRLPVLRAALAAGGSGLRVHTAASGEDLLESGRRLSPRLAVVDAALCAPAALLALRIQNPQLPVLALCADGAPLLRALQIHAAPGADGDVAALARACAAALRAPPRLRAADAPLEPLARRLASLTPQQLRVLLALAGAPLNKQLASDFGVTEGTVKTHVTALLRKLGLSRRLQAALLAQWLIGGARGAPPPTRRA